MHYRRWASCYFGTPIPDPALDIFSALATLARSIQVMHTSSVKGVTVEEIEKKFFQCINE